MDGFTMPVRLFQGKKCVTAHAPELSALGTRALIVTGRHSARACGALDDVTEALNGHDVFYHVFDQIEENPSVETVVKAADAGREAGADFVIGIGGGSPMDAAKAAALLLANSKADWTYLYDAARKTDAVPVVCIPTTCGTGSEATAVSVLTRHDLETKGSLPHRIFPTLSLVDPAYLLSAPLSLIADTAIDAFCHLIESVLNTGTNAYVRMCAEGGLRLFGDSREALFFACQRKDSALLKESVLSDLMMASSMAGMAISVCGTCLPHGLSYALTYRLGMPHGRAAGFFLEGFLEQAPTEDRERLLSLAGFSSLTEWRDFYITCCHPEKVPEEVLLEAVDRVGASPARLAVCPWAVGRQELCKMAQIDC